MQNAEQAANLSRLLQMFRDQGDLSRVELIRQSGMSRSMISHRLTTLLDAGLIRSLRGGKSTGGRPSSRFTFNAGRATVLCADIDDSGLVAAICDLAGTPIRHVTAQIDVWHDPEHTLSLVADAFAVLIEGAEIWGIGIGVPNSGNYAGGHVEKPSRMAGWANLNIAGWISQRFPGLVVIENDVNARAVAEARWFKQDNLIALKLGAGISCGLVFRGHLIHGADGAAGDLGHVRAGSTSTFSEITCRCGQIGCLEAYASGWALVRDIAEAGTPACSVAEIVELVHRGDREAVRLVSNAGYVIGEAVADMVGILNPAAIVISGQLAACDEALLTGIRERACRRAPATRNPRLHRSELGELAGVVGLALIAADELFAPAAIGDLIARNYMAPTHGERTRAPLPVTRPGRTCA